MLSRWKDGKAESMKEEKRQCEAVKGDGIRCQAAALPDSGFCFFHDPARAEERKAAQTLGGSQGKAKTIPDAAPDVEIENCQDIVRLLVQTINQVRKGTLDPKVANSVGYLSNIALKAFEDSDLEKRLAELETVVKRDRPPLQLTGS